MEITEKQYRKWLTMANIITNKDYEESHEILHTVLEKVLLKFKIGGVIDNMDNFIFRSLRNTFINSKKKSNDELATLQLLDEQTDYIEELFTEVDDTDIKLKVIEDVVSGLEYFDKQLYILHYLRGIPQRKIARDLGAPVTITIVHTRLTKIKRKIQSEYEKRTEEV